MNRHRFAPLLAAVVALAALVATGPAATARGGPGASASATFGQVVEGTQGCDQLYFVVDVTRLAGASTADVDVAFGSLDYCEESLELVSRGTATVPADAFLVAPGRRSAALTATVPLCNTEHAGPDDPCDPVPPLTFDVAWTATGEPARGGGCRPALAGGSLSHAWYGSVTLEPSEVGFLCRLRPGS